MFSLNIQDKIKKNPSSNQYQPTNIRKEKEK